MKCLHPKLKMTGLIITGRYEKRGVKDDAAGGAYYCVGEKAVCKCGAAFIVPVDKHLRIVEIETNGSRPRHE